MVLQVKTFHRFFQSSIRFKSGVASKYVPKESQDNIETIIGLEIHAQLLTKSKLFSLSPVNSDAASNSAVSDFDLGIPGTLPSLNKECVQVGFYFNQ